MVGLKPTLGTISTVGLVPACKTADCITILASTIQTATAALDVMQEYDEDDVYARVLQPPQPPWNVESSGSIVQYALPPSDLLDSALSPEYADLFARFMSALRMTSFARETNCDYEPFAKANAMLYGSSIVSQRIVAFKDYLQSHGYDQLHPVVAEIFKASSGFDAVRAYEDIFALAEYKRLAHKQFRGSSPSQPETGDKIDFLIVPSTTVHPTVEEMLKDPLELNKRLGTFTHFVNLLDLCAVSVPIKATWASKTGKPMAFGVTLISLPGRDRELLALGKRLMDLEIE